MLLPPPTPTTRPSFPHCEALSPRELTRLDAVLLRAAERLAAAWSDLLGRPSPLVVLSVLPEPAELPPPLALDAPTVTFAGGSDTEARLLWSPRAAHRLVSAALGVPPTDEGSPLSPVQSAVLVAFSRAALGALRAGHLLLTPSDPAVLAAAASPRCALPEAPLCRLVLADPESAAEPLAVLATRAGHVRRAARSLPGGAGRPLALAALLGCPVTVCACFAESPLSLRSLLSLRLGDVVALDEGGEAPVHLRVGGRAKFVGQAGMDGGRLAVRITEGSPAPQLGRWPVNQNQASLGPSEPEAVAAESLGGGADTDRALTLLGDICLPVEVRLGQAELPLAELLSLQPGSVVALDQDPTAPVDLLVGGRVVARGEVVLVEGGLGVRVTEILEQPRP